MTKVFVKLPVILGDTFMASAFLIALKCQFPDATIDVIIGGGL